MLRKIFYLLPILILLMSGCGSHYIVHDPATGNSYYTKDVDRTGDAGAVKFKDHATGSKVIIQQSEVRKISEDEYDAGMKQRK